jgi:type IX secretion system PorP/SprF family membrane protein
MFIQKTEFLLLAFVFGLSGRLVAQQEPMFTKYWFNPLLFNPAYAGSNEHLTINALHRRQWLGIEGAPVTQSLSAHSPFSEGRAGAGIQLMNDKAGATGVFDVHFSYAYRIQIGEAWRLAGGLQAGFGNWRSSWSKLRIEQPVDIAFQSDYNRWLPNFGAGLYLSNDRFYAGLGCPRIVEYDLRKSEQKDAINARNYRHYYTTAGAVFPLNRFESVVFRPSLLLKTTGWFSFLRKNDDFSNIGAPTQLDLDASFLFFQTFWIGAAYRAALERRTSSDDSADLWAAWQLRNGLRIGGAYDIPLSRIRKTGSGSFELLLGYEFDIKTDKVVNPRYF